VILGESLREGRERKTSQQLGRTRHRDLAGGIGSAGRSENAWRLAFLRIRLLLVCCNAVRFCRAAGTPSFHNGGRSCNASIMGLFIAVNKDHAGGVSNAAAGPTYLAQTCPVREYFPRACVSCYNATSHRCGVACVATEIQHRSQISRVQTRSHRGRWSAYEYVTSYAGYF
jgi:hypothetical protein